MRVLPGQLMRTKVELFLGPNGLAIAYEQAVKDVYSELNKLVIKKGSKEHSIDYNRGWNDCIRAVSKNIKIQNGKWPPKGKS